ncbi:MAG: type III pantothenate kinase [Deltaproteobacteria bacterium]|nr:MAG: type III pantothenate kinase [Deltaproteobacteria bacterium]
MKSLLKHSLVVDIGNSNIVLGLCTKNKIQKTWRIPTNVSAIKKWVHSFSKSQAIERIIVSSVVPTIHASLKKEFKKLNAPTHLLTYQDFTALKLKVKHPSRVGVDRLVNAIAAHTLYKGDLLIIDIGTATTFDIVTSQGEFLGGVITPGPQTINWALFEKCVQLPYLPLKRPPKVIGQETKSAIHSGVYYGYLSLLEGMIEKIQKEFGAKLKVILTGGPASLFAPSITKSLHNPQLTLLGLMETRRP